MAQRIQKEKDENQRQPTVVLVSRKSPPSMPVKKDGESLFHLVVVMVKPNARIRHLRILPWPLAVKKNRPRRWMKKSSYCSSSLLHATQWNSQREACDDEGK